MQAIMRLPRNKKGSKLNIFAQLAEPSKKEGIWIKTTDEKYNYSIVDIRDNFEGDKYIGNYSMPGKFIGGVLAEINNEIYLFGLGNGKFMSYKYNPKTKIYTRLADIPNSYNLSGTGGTTINNEVYLFGVANKNSSSSYNDINTFKYNPITNTYTQLASQYFYSATVVAIKNKAYIIGGKNSPFNIYVYDPITDTFTLKRTMSFNPYSATVFNDEAYLFQALNTYKYNPETNLFTKLLSVPSQKSSVVARVNDKIYLFGSSDSNANKITYRYNITTNTYTQLLDNPLNIHTNNNPCIPVNNTVWFFGANYPKESDYDVSYEFVPFIAEDKSILIQSGTNHKTKLTNNMEVNFNQTKIYDNYNLQDYPTYVGNGQSWELLN